MRSFILRWLSLAPAAKSSGAKRANGKAKPHYRLNTREPDDFRAVELRGHGPICAAARARLGKRVLIADATPLPLPDCTLARCTCSYKNHADRRREEPRRLVDVGVSGTFYTGPERRSGLDRRQSHRAADDTYYDYVRRR